MKIKGKMRLNGMLILLGLVIFVVSAGGALGVVWLRQQVACAADRCLTLEKSLAMIQRSNIDLDGQIAGVNSPEYLKTRIGGKMGFPRAENIVWVEGGRNFQALASKGLKRLQESDLIEI